MDNNFQSLEIENYKKTTDDYPFTDNNSIITTVAVNLDSSINELFPVLPMLLLYLISQLR